MKENISAKKPVLTTLHVWVMAIATGLVVANIYYNQPLLGDISRDFNVSEAKGGMMAMLTQIGYAAGMLFCVPLGDMFKRKQLIMTVFVIDIFALLMAAWSPNIHFLMIDNFVIVSFSI